jgi:hypothetical protein
MQPLLLFPGYRTSRMCTHNGDAAAGSPQFHMHIRGFSLMLLRAIAVLVLYAGWQHCQNHYCELRKTLSMSQISSRTISTMIRNQGRGPLNWLVEVEVAEAQPDRYTTIRQPAPSTHTHVYVVCMYVHTPHQPATSPEDMAITTIPDR